MIALRPFFYLKVAIVALAAIFISLMAAGVLFGSKPLCLTALVIFGALGALAIYYAVKKSI